ncbi:MAG: serine/threonine-protein kinase [Polyangiaceae bacterium]
MSRMPPHLESNDAGKSTDLLVGRTIGEKFALEAVIGAGAMGAVYRARQIALEKIVAVKVMHRGLLADATFATRFHREAKAASRLDHPNSIRILDFGEEPDGLLYIVMDYLDGRDLLRVIQEDWPLPSWRIVDIMSQVLSALAVAHDMGVLHRDLKPENIMVLRHLNDDGTPTDVVKVLDFGIAKITEQRDTDNAPVSSTYAKLSTGGMLVGTPAYMSPEQAQGEPLDQRSDLYSIGVILYQILTLCLPFEAASAVGLLLKHVHEKPPSPSSVSSAVHPGLETVCLRAMSKQRRDRYPNAREMRTALKGAIGVDARPSVRERQGALSPSPSVVHVGPKPQGVASANADMPTLASIPSLPPAGFPPEEQTGPVTVPRGARPWLAGAAVILTASVFLLPRWRRGNAVEPVHTLVSPTPTAAQPPPNAAAPAPTEPDRAMRIDLARPHAPATASASLKKGAKGKAAPVEPREEPVVATPAPPPADPATNPPASLAPVIAEPVPPPVVETPPAPPPPPEPVAATPTPPPSPPAAVPPPPNPALARVEIGPATSTTGTTASNVNKTLAPLAAKLTACYRGALAHLTQATDESGILHVETNEDGVIMEARLLGPLAPGAGRCIVGAVRGRRISNVDTGSATADVPLAFKVR